MSPEHNIQDALSHGAIARMNGEEQTTNPYSENSSLWRAWSVGWEGMEEAISNGIESGLEGEMALTQIDRMNAAVAAGLDGMISRVQNRMFSFAHAVDERRPSVLLTYETSLLREALEELIKAGLKRALPER